MFLPAEKEEIRSTTKYCKNTEYIIEINSTEKSCWYDSECN